MKKKVLFVFLILCFLFVAYKIHFLTIKEHHVTYSLNGYEIEEYYEKKPEDTYHLFITKGKNTYTYTIHNNLKKEKEIIKEIKSFKKGNLVCIVPIYNKEVENNLYCTEDNIQVSNDYLMKNREEYKEIQKKVKKYKIQYPNSSETKKVYKNITVYNDNILENEVFYIWNYKGIYILDKNKNKQEQILDYDLYDNIMTCTIKDRFVLLENSSVKGIQNIYYYDYKKSKLKVAKPEKILSKNSYINGVKDNLVYITDRKGKRQYTLDITKGKLMEIDEEETLYTTYQKGIKEELSKSDFFLKDQHFDEQATKDILYYQEGDKIYKVYYKKRKNPILLLELDNIKEWKVKGEEILILREDTLYAYHDKKGIRKIIENKEFIYNYENIYQMGEI